MYMPLSTAASIITTVLGLPLMYLFVRSITIVGYRAYHHKKIRELYKSYSAQHGHVISTTRSVTHGLNLTKDELNMVATYVEMLRLSISHRRFIPLRNLSDKAVKRHVTKVIKSVDVLKIEPEIVGKLSLVIAAILTDIIEQVYANEYPNRISGNLILGIFTAPYFNPKYSFTDEPKIEFKAKA